MKNISLALALSFLSSFVSAQNPIFDNQFRGFFFSFEQLPRPNQIGEIAVRYSACARPYSIDFSGFPTQVDVTESRIRLIFSFWIPNSPGCALGRVQYYSLPPLLNGQYELNIVGQLIENSGPQEPPRIVETRTMAQINFQVGEPLVTQVPNLTPVGFALMSLMMLGVGAFVCGRRYS